MKKLKNTAVPFIIAAVISFVMCFMTMYMFCSCSHPQSQDKWLDENEQLLHKVELYEQYYSASENFLKMAEKAEWTFHNHDWDDTYWCSEEGQDLIEAKADIDAMLSSTPIDSTCIYVPSYDDLLKERNLLWDLLQVTAVQDTVAWETKVKKLPEWKEYDKFLLHDWEDMEWWKYPKPVDLQYEELSEE